MTARVSAASMVYATGGGSTRLSSASMVYATGGGSTRLSSVAVVVLDAPLVPAHYHLGIRKGAQRIGKILRGSTLIRRVYVGSSLTHLT